MKFESVPQFLEFEVYPNLDYAALFPHLNPEDQKYYIRIDCPKCRRRTAVIEKGNCHLVCHKDVGCGFRRSIVELIAFPKRPHGDVYRNIIAKLTAQVGKEIPPDLYGQPGAPRKKKVKAKRPIPKLESLEQFRQRGGQIRKY